MEFFLGAFATWRFVNQLIIEKVISDWVNGILLTPSELVSLTHRLENTLNYGLERVWAIGYMKSSRR